MKNEAQKQMSVRLNDEINRTCIVLSDKKTDVMDVDYIANVVQSRIDEHAISPTLVEYSSILNIKQMTRAQLRKHWNPTLRAEQAVDEENQPCMFSDDLQDYYPSKREILGVVKSVYVRRDLLTHDEVVEIASKMRKVSEKLAKHCDALIAWDKSRD